MLPPPCAKDRNEWSYTSTLSIYLYGVDRDDCTCNWTIFSCFESETILEGNMVLSIQVVRVQSWTILRIAQLSIRFIVCCCHYRRQNFARNNLFRMTHHLIYKHLAHWSMCNLLEASYVSTFKDSWMIGFEVDSKKKVNGTGSCCQRFLEPTQLISPEKYR